MRKENSTNTINQRHLEEVCGMAHTISVMGGRWKLSILGVLADFGGVRYNELRKHIGGISDRMLAKQLKALEGDGLITKKVEAHVPVKVTYALSKKGQSLTPIFQLMTEWGSTQLRNCG